jgi:Ca-activated chloride channel family protein
VNTLAQFHFLRPGWLLLLLPAIALAFLLWRQRSSGANWRRAIAPELIDYLIEPAREQQRHWPWLLLMAWSIAIAAIAGPTWEKIPQPVLQKRDGLVIVLDLSLSMYAQDIQPSRLQRARYKVLDILQRRHEGLTGLVVYSGDAHVVAPLTDDTATIANLVPALSPAMMPAYGSDPIAAVDNAEELLRNAGFERGRVLLISDEISADNINDLAARYRGKSWQLSIIGVGTEQGAPIPLPGADNGQSGFFKQANGTIAVAQLHRERFIELANKTHARYSDIRLDDSDLNAVLPNTVSEPNEVRTVQREFDQWRERGPQLVWLLLPLAALTFRRGWLLALLLLPISPPSHALEWPSWAPQGLWQTPDQHAQQLLQNGNAKNAAAEFRDPAWRGAAQYRAGDYQAAAQTLGAVDSADAQYNRGNALARAGKLQDAIAAYDAALKKNPQLEDATANRELIEKLLQQQQKNPTQQDSSAQQNNQSSSQQNQSSQNHSSQNNGSASNQSTNNPSTGNPSADSSSANKQAADNDNSSSKQGQNKNNQQNAGNNTQTNNESEQHDQAGAKNAEQKPARENSNDDDQATAATKSPDSDAKTQSATAAPDHAQQMQQRATEQWLRQIPDDPSGLLRRKFIYENRQRERNVSPRSDQPAW